MTDSIRAALMTRFAPPEFATFYEVANATGWKGNRRADAIAMNLYPSRGLAVHGVEIKVSRADWLRELKDPDKSAPIQFFCDHWWVAVADAKIVRDGELPKTWGLLVMQGAKLVQKVEAPKLAAAPMDRAFIAALLRKATENMVPRSELSRLAREQAEQIAQANASGDAHLVQTLTRSNDELQKAISSFEEKSGIRISSYDGERIGEAVRHVMYCGGQVSRALEQEERHLAGLLENIRAARAALAPKAGE